jgi:hypothetical protein
MAIQLNERDHLIFKLISEHHVLLEKHISWFIAGEDKPVLIRDRLRKLFYLDYLLCQRHNTKLPWWTTPTKPLVYMLSPMSRSLAGTDSEALDLFDSEVQRQHLEIANIRMLCLVAQKAGEINNLDWTTCEAKESGKKQLDAIVKFVNGNRLRKVGIISHPRIEDSFCTALWTSFEEEAPDSIAIVSRDESHQELVRALLCQYSDRLNLDKLLLVTHHELYKSGIIKAAWRTAKLGAASLIDQSSDGLADSIQWHHGFTPPRAASA